MKIAYLILAHKNPAQLTRLISRLNDENVFFSIHVSLTASTSLEGFKSEVDKVFPNAKNIQFSKRFKGTWGSFNFVKIAVELIRSVLEFELDYHIIISAQDYPIKSRSDFYSFLTSNKSRVLMEYKEVDWPENKISRINSYFFPDFFTYGKRDKPSILARVVTKILPRRKFLEGMKPYTGRYWSVLPFDVAKFLVAEYDNNKKLNDYFKYVLLPEEQYFHTILLNSRFAERVDNVKITFADNTTHRTATWQSKDFDLLKKAECLFARKFEPEVDENILDIIDDQLLGKAVTKDVLK